MTETRTKSGKVPDRARASIMRAEEVNKTRSEEMSANHLDKSYFSLKNQYIYQIKREENVLRHIRNLKGEGRTGPNRKKPLEKRMDTSPGIDDFSAILK